MENTGKKKNVKSPQMNAAASTMDLIMFRLSVACCAQSRYPNGYTCLTGRAYKTWSTTPSVSTTVHSNLY